MELMPVLRAQLPLPAAPPPVAETSRSVPPGTTPAVAAPEQPQAVQVALSAAASLPVHRAPIDEDGPPVSDARFAAEAAWKAYIRASIAAGVSPLPLP